MTTYGHRANRVRGVLPDGRGTGVRDYRRGTAAQAAVLAEVRRKAEARLPLTRGELHLLWQDYRHRERESVV